MAKLSKMDWRERSDLESARSRIEQTQDWREWARQVPKIRWPADMAVAAVPPWGNALVRYFVEVDGVGFKSVYLDVWDSLGCVGHPYWEVHPVHGDCGRVSMNDVDGLIALLREPRGWDE